MAISGKHPLQYFLVNVATISTPELVAAPAAGKKIVLLNYTLVAGGVTSFTWKSAANAKSGPMGAGAAAVVDASGTPESPCLECNYGEALNIQNSAAIQLSGHGTYIVTD